MTETSKPIVHTAPGADPNNNPTEHVVGQINIHKAPVQDSAAPATIHAGMTDSELFDLLQAEGKARSEAAEK